MKYTKLFLLGFTVLAVMSCRNKSNLEEVVQIPEPEAQETQSVYGNPADVKAEKGKLINISSDNEKSFIVTEDESVYISPISPQTLKIRSKKNGFSGGSE